MIIKGTHLLEPPLCLHWDKIIEIFHRQWKDYANL